MPDRPRLRRTPDDPWLSTRMRHSAELGQRQLALTDAFAAATSRALAHLREMVLPSEGARPMLPDPAMAQSVFAAACEEFVQPLVSASWWEKYGQDFASSTVPEVLDNLRRVLAQAASDPSVSREQERAAALAMLHLGGGELPTLTAAGDEPTGWNVKWVKAWSTWNVVAELDDDAAVARGHARVADALTDVLRRTVDEGIRRGLQNQIDKRLSAAAAVNPSAAKLTAAIDQFTSASGLVGNITGRAPFPGAPSKPVSTAPAGQKNYYTRAQRRARSVTVSSFNQEALDRARANAEENGTRLVKTWLATADARTREDHEDADGQQVGLDEPFIVGGEELAYPGDPDGSDEQTINCRCTFITEEASGTGSDGDGGNLLSLTAAAAQEEPSMDEDELPIGWEGVLCPLDTISGDGREIATPAALRLRQAPIPFSSQLVSAPEHDNSVRVGRVDEAWVEGGMLMGRGVFDLGSDEGREAARQLGAGFASRVSVDLDDVTVDFREAEADPDVEEEDDEDIFFMPEGTLVMTDWRLAGVTLVTISAFDEAIITPVYATSTAESPTTSGTDASGHVTTFAIDGEVAVGDTVSFDDPDNPGTTVQGTVTEIGGVGEEDDTTVSVSLPATDGSEDARIVTVPLADVTVVGDDAEAQADALVASTGVAPLRPPSTWFENPNYGIGGEDKRLVRLQGQSGGYAAPIRIDEDGRISGHLAAWGVCHTGLPGCTTAPQSRTNYAKFLLGETLTDDGTRLSTGTLTYDTGHADIGLSRRAALRHYDNTGTAFASVVVGEDAYGIWVAGALLPDVKPEVVPRLRAAKLSGDWRGGEMIAALAVNTPGFPVTRSRSDSLDSVPRALVASAIPRFVKKRRGISVDVDKLALKVEKRLKERAALRAQADAMSRRVNPVRAELLARRLPTRES